MHSLLEHYLEEVAGRLGPLPVARRNDELKEMRQHLFNAVTVNREMGQSEDEAAHTALEQFGPPVALGENLVWAWRRERTLAKRSFWGAAALTAVAVPLVFLSLMEVLRLASWLFHVTRPSDTVGFFVVQGWSLMAYVLTGTLAGLTFPSRAVSGACLGLAVFTFIWYGSTGRNVWPTTPHQYWYWFGELAHFVSALLATWAASRWRLHRGQAGRGRRWLPSG